jgi:tripartite-type tricarboxylate transporter receptor subunit TctC
MPYKAKVTATLSWADIPPCKTQGMDVDYQMLRGIFMPGGVTKEQVAFYIELFKKIQATPDWKEFMEKGAFDSTTLTGDEFVKWLTKEEQRHQSLMSEAGFLAKK